jgi:hypothetical protein
LRFASSVKSGIAAKGSALFFEKQLVWFSFLKILFPFFYPFRMAFALLSREYGSTFL